jgi:hypothetical protein
MIGIDGSYKYFEISCDSVLATRSNDGGLKENNALFDIRPIHNVVGLKVLEVEIPFSFFTFTDKNNKFYLRESITTGPPINPVVVIIPSGNYSATEMLTVLAQALELASGNGWTYLVEINQATQKFIIWNEQAVANSSFSLDFIIEPSIAVYLGFKNGEIYTSGGTIDPVKGRSLYAPFVFNMSGPNYLYVNSTILGTLVDMYRPGETAGPYLARIQNTVLPGEVIFWRDPDPEKYFNLENLNVLSQFDLYLTAGFPDTQSPLDLNGSSFSLKLGIIVQTDIKDDLMSRSESRISKRVRG